MSSEPKSVPVQDFVRDLTDDNVATRPLGYVAAKGKAPEAVAQTEPILAETVVIQNDSITPEEAVTDYVAPRLSRHVATLFVVAVMVALIGAFIGGKIGTIIGIIAIVIAAMVGLLLAQSIKRLEDEPGPLVESLNERVAAARKCVADKEKEVVGRLRIAAKSNVDDKATARKEIVALEEKIAENDRKAKSVVPRPVARALLKLLLTQHPRVRPHNIFEIKADGKAVQINLADEEVAGRPAVSVELLGEASVGNEKPPYMYVRLYEGAFIWGNVVINVMRDEDRWGLVVCRYIAGVPDWDNAVSVELGRDQNIVGIGKIFATGNVLDANRHFIQNVPAWVFPVDEGGPTDERTINPTDIAGRLQKMRAEWRPAGRTAPLATAHPAANGIGRPPVAPPSNGG